jgi:hypothetical protein
MLFCDKPVSTLSQHALASGGSAIAPRRAWLSLALVAQGWVEPGTKRLGPLQERLMIIVTLPLLDFFSPRLNGLRGKSVETLLVSILMPPSQIERMIRLKSLVKRFLKQGLLDSCFTKGNAPVRHWMGLDAAMIQRHKLSTDRWDEDVACHGLDAKAAFANLALRAARILRRRRAGD